ncbi:MAG: RNA polymerase sigma factor [Saprospiraceae bacterium]|nr:RNA polymerase sigma factor [Saprospiraceae bacterium]
MVENDIPFFEKSYLGNNQADWRMAVTLEEFQTAFIDFQKELKSYILRATGSHEDAEDLAQDTYIKAAQHIESFQGRSSLRAWVFAIASNLIKDHFRAKQRWSVRCMDNASKDAQENPELIDKMKALSEKTPAGKFEIREHINFCFTCMSKTLPIEQQLALILKDVYEFKVQEIMEILQLTEGRVKHLLAYARGTMTDILSIAARW